MNAGESPRGGLDSTERLEAHLRSTPLAAIEFDLERRARRWNPAAERIFGYSHEEVRDVDCFPLLVPSELGSEVDQIWQQLVAGRGGGANTNLNRTKDGRTILCRWYNTPLRDERGEVVAVASLAEDITERAAAEREVRESRSRLAAVVGHLPVLVWALDASGEVTFWNDFAASTSGYSREALRGTEGGCGGLTGRRGSLHAGPEGTGRDYDRWELPLECADGQFRRIMWSGLAERCPIPGWASWGVGIDVTDARDAEEALRRSERRFREVLETIELAGVILDRDQRVLYCNEFMERLTGLPRDQIVGTDWVETFTEPDRRAEVSRDMREAFEGRAFTRRVDGAIRSVDGSKRIVSWNRAVIRDSVGRVTAATALGLDVTDARQAERELSKYRAELERLVHERTEALDESRRRLEAAERLAALGELAAGIGHDLG
ncbi:MAG: PAS domain S-box protein, partial [Planctomycetota bacterium]